MRLGRELSLNMKRAFAAIVPGFLLLILLPATRDELSWHFVASRNNSPAYQGYLDKWPAGRHAAQAKTLVEMSTWSEALAINTPASYERYEHSFPNGQHVAEARTRIMDLVWEHFRNAGPLRSAQAYVEHYCKSTNREIVKARLENLVWNLCTNASTIRSLRTYVDAYPEGRFLAEAHRRQAGLVTNDAAYLSTASQGTAEALHRFLREFPGHAREPEAKHILTNILEKQRAEVSVYFMFSGRWMVAWTVPPP